MYAKPVNLSAPKFYFSAVSYFLHSLTMENITIKVTDDGSHTLYHQKLNEHYHSVHGALQESRLVFIEYGLQYVLPNLAEINLLEVGFGTGLNALLAVIEAKKQKRKINYVAIEPYPLGQDWIEKLNYPTLIAGTEAAGYFNKLHAAGWVYPVYLSDYFILSKLQANIQDVALNEGKFNLVFFDAFGPEVQPELWTAEVFGQLYNSLAPGGVLVTYSCKGIVKKALKSVGFAIEKLPGPAGKREVLRAIKNGG